MTISGDPNLSGNNSS
jgi:hypothetical protein